MNVATLFASRHLRTAQVDTCTLASIDCTVNMAREPKLYDFCTVSSEDSQCLLHCFALLAEPVLAPKADRYL